MLRFNLSTFFIVCLAILIGLSYTAQAAEEEKVLNIYNWTEYLAPDTIPNFEKETGIKVRYDTFETNEELDAKLNTKKIGYDIVVPSSGWAKQQIGRGLFQKLDKSLLPNYKNLDPSILEKLTKYDPDNQYLVNWLWGYTTIGVNVDLVLKTLGKTTMPDNLWDLVFDPYYASKLASCGLTILDSPSEIFPPALHYIGKPPFSANEADYEQATRMLKKIRPYIKEFNTSENIIKGLGNGSICVAIAWVGDINAGRKLSAENKSPHNIVALFPKTGVFMFMDTMAITANAKHPKNAHLFINYILRPEVHAALTNATHFANPNKASLPFVKPELKVDGSIFLNALSISKLVAPDVADAKAIKVMEPMFESFKVDK